MTVSSEDWAPLVRDKTRARVRVGMSRGPLTLYMLRLSKS